MGFITAAWWIAIIFFTISIKSSLTKEQERKIQESTYTEEITVDGVKKIITKSKCPTCGNRDMGYQMVSSHAFNHNYNNDGIGFLHISNSKYAVCSKCGTSFNVINRPTPFINGILAFMLSNVICVVLAVVIFILSIVFQGIFG